MKREMLKIYESPLTVRTQVALESGICSASADPQNPNNSSYGKIDAQSVNTDFATSADFSTSGWDTNQ